MPELPEVETVARQLNASIKGKVIGPTKIHDKAKIKLLGPRLVGKKIKRVWRSGKQIVIELSGGVYLVVHLRMTGMLIWEPLHSNVKPNKPRYIHDSSQTAQKPRLSIQLTGGWLRFYDTRRFGTVQLHTDPTELAPAGLEPFSSEFTVTRLTQLCQASNQALKIFLLRQDKVVGIGNIYASEILWDAKLSPFTKASNLTPREVRRLYKSTIKILKRAIDNCGTSFSDFADSSGESGSNQNYLRVYLREGLTCRRCRETVLRVNQGQRSTYYCPGCQLPLASNRTGKSE